MATSRPRPLRPRARLRLGLLLATAGWQGLPVAAAHAGGVAPPPAARPGLASAPRPPLATLLTLRRMLRQRGPALAVPLDLSAPPAAGSAAAEPAAPPFIAGAPVDAAPLAPPLRPRPSLTIEAAGSIAPATGPLDAAEPFVPLPVPRLPPVTVATAGPPPAPPIVNAPQARQLLPARRDLHRDPVEPPLLDPALTWRELVLQVTLNGQVASQGALFAEDEGGRVAVELAALRAWRVRTDDARILTFKGEPYYPLDAIGGATWTLDRAGLSIALEVPPERFAATVLAEGDPERLSAFQPAAGRGAFLNYDLLGSAGGGGDPRVDGLTELGAFSEIGTLTTSAKLDDVAGPGAAVTRLDTTFSRDLPGRRATIRLGDALSGGGAFAAPVRFAGVQYATAFGTDPSFVPFPLPTIGGLARQESVVDVLLDNLRRVRRDVPAGPFSIDNLPVVTGSGELQLKVTDLLGREQVVTQPYYVSSRLLKPGLRDFSYEAGFQRERYGERGFAYGDPLAVATERAGLTDRLTGEAHLEVQPGLQDAAVGGSYLLGSYGVLTAGAAASLKGGERVGAMGELGYEYEGRRFNVGLRSRVASEGFEQAGASSGKVARTDQANLGIDLGKIGSLGLLALNRESYDDSDATSLSATFTRALGPGLLSLRASELVRPERELTLTAAFVLPLGLRRNVSTEVETRDGGPRARLEYRQTRGASDVGLDYRLGAGLGQGASDLDARATYQGRLGAVEAEAEHSTEGGTRGSLGVNGSVAWLDGRLGLTRQVGRAFGLVSLPGYPGVRVYVDNREAGRTDGRGSLLLPGLRPYEENKVRVEVEDLPLDAALKGNEATAVPFDRSGVPVRFDLDRREAATVVLRDAASGRPLPAGLTLSGADGAVTVQVAKAGFAQVAGPLAAGGVGVEGARDGRRFACDLPPAPAGELLPDLGAVACR